MNYNDNKIYVFSCPLYKGLIKIGQTTGDVHKRIMQMFPQHPETLKFKPYNLLYVTNAIDINGNFFQDIHIHASLKTCGIKQISKEWFECDVDIVKSIIEKEKQKSHKYSRVTKNKTLKHTFKRIDKRTGIESEIPTATAAEPIKDRAIIEGIKTALNTKKRRKYYALFCTGINTALRISDILKLRVSDIETGYVHITETKTGKRKQFPINDSLMAVLQNYVREFKLQDDDFLFFSNRKDCLRNVKYIDQSQAYRLLKDVIEGLYPSLRFSLNSLYKTYEYFKTLELYVV